jgi:diguanylate cyclase (GGDEF)-like protein
MSDVLQDISIDPELVERVRASRSLPSPPVVAARLIELGEDPNVSVDRLVDVLRPDPALTARLLRLANSPLYARRRRADNLHQAVVLLGLDAVFTAALSLTLVSDRRALGSSQLSFRDRWSRSVHAAVSAQMLARRCGGVIPGDAFLAGLMQDIGILVAARLEPDTYAPLTADSGHADFVAREIEVLGVDHAAIGAVLLEAWHLPPQIVSAVAKSHTGGDRAGDRLANIVTVGALVADWIAGEPEQLLAAVGIAERMLGLDRVELSGVLDEIADALPDLAVLLDAQAPPPEQLAEMAADAMVARQMQHRYVMQQMQEDLVGLSEVTRQLELANRTDVLTGLLNRRYLDEVLAREFERAMTIGHGLSVLFIDLDDFRDVNEAFGHQGGDAILCAAAEMVTATLRDGDMVGRFGGDELVVVLPATAGWQGDVVADRLVHAFARNPILVEHGVFHHQSITIGTASVDQLPEVESVSELVRLADEAMYVAKRNGKGRWVNASALVAGRREDHPPFASAAS